MLYVCQMIIKWCGKNWKYTKLNMPYTEISIFYFRFHKSGTDLKFSM